MGSMANEMEARIRADGGAGLANGGDAGGAPGSAGDPPNQPAPPAGESNTDTAAGNGAPETIPYARFKEVNDRYNELKPVEELFQYGYDADSLRRLASFEASYLQDPIGTVATMAENLDLPQETIDAIRAHVAGSNGGNGRAEGEPVGDGEGAPVLPPGVKERLDYVDKLKQRDEDAVRQAQLDSVVEAWDKLDKEESVETPERIKLMAISAAANSGRQFTTFEDLAKAARETISEYRESVLGSAVRTGRRGESPPALPGSPPAAAPPLDFKGNIKAASRAAEEAIRRGELPPLT